MYEHLKIEERDLTGANIPLGGGTVAIMTTFGIGPCREIGTIKDAIKDAILDGQIPNDRDAAWQMMLDIAATLDLQPVHNQ